MITKAQLAQATQEQVTTFLQEFEGADAQLRADLTAADDTIRRDMVAADGAARAAYDEAIAAGKSEAEAKADAAIAKAVAAEAAAEEAKRIAAEKSEAAVTKADEAKKAADESRQKSDQAISAASGAGPEGPLTGIDGWLGILIDLILMYLGLKGVQKGGGAGLRKLGDVVAKRTTEAQPKPTPKPAS